LCIELSSDEVEKVLQAHERGNPPGERNGISVVPVVWLEAQKRRGSRPCTCPPLRC
jgi:hypothetical protein